MRKRFILWLFEKTQKGYLKFKKKKSWNITKGELLQLPKDTLGYELGEFLKKNNFDLISKSESHDIYHVLLGYGTQVEDEIALQFACFGNGKRSLYLLLSLLAGILLLPEYIKYYQASYLLGNKSASFHELNYEKLLRFPISELREKILITDIINTYQWKSYKHKEEGLVNG